MKILPILAITAFIHWSATPAAQAAGDNAYKVNLVAKSVHKNDAGRLVESFYTGRDVVRACARQNDVDASGLSLVYDLDADSFQVVRNTDGSVLCESMSLGGGQSLVNANNTRAERLAFVFLGSDPEAKGSAMTTTQNRNRFNVSGDFQFATSPTDTSSANIVSGFFSTGAKFASTNPPPPPPPTNPGSS